MSGARTRPLVAEGATVEAAEQVAEVGGPVASIRGAAPLALTWLHRLSAVASGATTPAAGGRPRGLGRAVVGAGRGPSRWTVVPGGVRGVAMLLAADVGNTEIVLGVFDGDDPAAHLAFVHPSRAHLRRAGAAVVGVPGAPRPEPPVRHRRALPRERRAGRDRAFREMASSYLSHEPLVVGPGMKTGVSVLTDNPKEVGADRIVNTLRGPRALRRPDRGRGLRHGHDLRRRLRERRSTWAASSSPALRSRPARSSAPRPGCRASRSCRRARSIGRTTVESDAVRAGLRDGGDGRRHRRADPRRSSAPRRDVVATGGLAPVVVAALPDGRSASRAVAHARGAPPRL